MGALDLWEQCRQTPGLGEVAGHTRGFTQAHASPKRWPVLLSRRFAAQSAVRPAHHPTLRAGALCRGWWQRERRSAPRWPGPVETVGSRRPTFYTEPYLTVSFWHWGAFGKGSRNLAKVGFTEQENTEVRVYGITAGPSTALHQALF